MCNLQYFFALVSFVLLLLSVSEVRRINAVPAIFVFGDSLVDVGNNNYIKTKSVANHKPHGIDFGKPTGRYTNGKTIIDIIGQKLGAKKFIPPYLAPTTKGNVILKGVNYASGSSGILNETGIKFFKNNINMDAQIDNFAKTRKSIIKLKGQTGAEKLLRSNSLFPIVIGSNDMLNNYLLPFLSSWNYRRKTPPSQFVSILMTRLRKQLGRLYKLDARKFILVELSPIGCIPFMRDRNLLTAGSGCHKSANNIALKYNKRLKKLANDLGKQFNGTVFVYVHTYTIISDILRNYKSLGFEKTEDACCHVLGKHGGLLGCPSSASVCPDRSKYVFWDGFHPSEATYAIVAKRILDGDASQIEPMNVRKLVKARTY